MTNSQHVYEVRPRKDHRGVDLISDALPFGRLWYGGTERGQQSFRVRAVLGPLTSCRDPCLRAVATRIETQEHRGDFP